MSQEIDKIFKKDSIDESEIVQVHNAIADAILKRSD